MIHLTTVKVSKNKWVITPSDCVDKHKKEKAETVFNDTAFFDEMLQKAIYDNRHAALEEEFNLKRII